MALPSLAEIEDSLLPYRIARAALLESLLTYILSNNQLTDPYRLLTRMFVRLKSSDSILEKIQRKRLVAETAEDIQRVMDDFLGFRIITSDLKELDAIDKFLATKYRVRSKRDFVNAPDEFGYRSIEYSLVYEVQDQEIPFEIQLRTLLQHYWSARSFFLFHKKPVSEAEKHLRHLQSLGELLAEVENVASTLGQEIPIAPSIAVSTDAVADLPICSQLNLIVIEPGERFVTQSRLTLTEDQRSDHERIVERKLSLYNEYPSSAIVECACMSFLSFTMNEPLVIVPPERLSQINW